MTEKIVTHVSTVHPQDDIRIYHKEITSLAESAWTVNWICPEYRQNFTPPDCINFYPLQKPMTRLQRLALQVRVFRLIRALKSPIVHLHDPELLPLGLLLQSLGQAVIYDAHENTSEQILTKPWIPAGIRPAVSKMTGWLEHFIVKRLAGLVAATPEIAQALKTEKCPAIVRNFPLLAELPALDSGRNGPGKKEKVLAYVGGISEIRGIRNMLNLVLALNEHMPCKLILAGTFSDAHLQNTCAQHPGWRFVEYRGWQNRQGVWEILHEADLGLVLLHPVPNYLKSIPIKMFEYMASGTPFIASEFPYWKELVKDYESGIFVDPFDTAAMTHLATELMDNPGVYTSFAKTGQAAVHTVFNWESEFQNLIDLYQRA